MVAHCQNTKHPGFVVGMLSVTGYQNIQVERSNQKYQAEGQEGGGPLMEILETVVWK